MKKIITVIALIAVSSLSAQIKEGSVTYAMIIEGLPADQAAMMGDMETKIFFKNNKSYSEMNSMMYSVKTLSDDNGSLMLMDQMGNKFFVKHTKADLEKETAKAKEPKIEYTNEWRSKYPLVIEILDGDYWEVYSQDKSVIEYLASTYKETRVKWTNDFSKSG